MAPRVYRRFFFHEVEVHGIPMVAHFHYDRDGLPFVVECWILKGVFAGVIFPICETTRDELASRIASERSMYEDFADLQPEHEEALTKWRGGYE